MCYNVGKMYVEEISLNMYLKIINKNGGKTMTKNTYSKYAQGGGYTI